MMARIYILIVTLFVFASCEKEVTDVQLPEAKSKLVLGCFLSASDTLITVTVTKSTPILNNTSPKTGNYIDNASITISDGVNSAILPTKGFGKYQLDSKIFPIIEGKEYTVSAFAAGFDNVYGKCIVPTAIPSGSASLNGSLNTTGSSIEIKWKDIPNQKNYYKIDIIGYLVKESFPQSDTIYNYVFYSNDSYRDDGKDGQDILAVVKLNKTYVDKGYTFKGYVIKILNMDYNYYMYNESMHNVSNNNSSDPFSEPSFVYTNVDKGLGVVGGYSLYRFYIK